MKTIPELQRPRYVVAPFLMWVFFFLLKLCDDYDGFMSVIGAPIVATFLLALTLPVLLLLGLIRRKPRFRWMWYGRRWVAAACFIGSCGILFFGKSLGMSESYTYTNSIQQSVTDTRLYLWVSVPAFLLAAFSVLYWPRRR